jgi:hypothetical protein
LGHTLAAPFTATFQLAEQTSGVRSVYLPLLRK